MRLRSALLLACLLAACGQKPGGTITLPPQNTGGGGGDSVTSCDADQDGFISTSCGGDDCDDRDPAVHPGAAEVCDGTVDENCNGIVDEGCACTPGDVQPCWPLDTPFPAKGACTQGIEVCSKLGQWGDCQGAVTPGSDSSCDGIDQDCDGLDTGCSSCPPGAVEICGNGLDDDCDGVIDNPSSCVVACDEVNPRDPGGRGCCLDPARPATSFVCQEDALLPACSSRPCLDLDGDPKTTCVSLCDGNICSCGAPDADGKPVASPGCGYATPCSLVDCNAALQQPCYSGPPATLGVGACHGGLADCGGAPGSRAWGTCVGEVKPLPGDICGNGIDDDCDGLVDENEGTGGGACPDPQMPEPGAVELCGNGIDDDGDGFADEGCPAKPGASQACWTGRLRQRNVGSCRDGTQVEVDGHFGPCQGQVLPRADRCGDGADDDCNGLGGPDEPEDPGCCVPAEGGEICNGVDDDCDGKVDEGLRTRCGTCGGDCGSELSVDDPASCGADGRICKQIDAAPGGLMTLGTDLSPRDDGSGFALQQDGTVSRLDATINAAVWTTALPAGLGPTDSQTLLPAPDGTAWTLWLGGGAAVVAHLDTGGKELCRFGQAAPSINGNMPAVRLHPSGRLRLYVAGADAAETGHRVTWELDPTLVTQAADGTRACVSVWRSDSTWAKPVVEADWPDDVPVWPGSRSFTTVSSSLEELGAGGSFVASWSLPGGYPSAVQVVRAVDGGLWLSLKNIESSAAWHFDPGAAPPSFAADPALTTAATPPLLITADAATRQAGLLGTWTQDLDSGSYQTRYHSLSFGGEVPDGARVSVRLRFADRQEDLDLAAGCGPFASSPAPLDACAPGDGRRFVRIEAELIGSPSGARPSMGAFQLSTSLP